MIHKIGNEHIESNLKIELMLGAIIDHLGIKFDYPKELRKVLSPQVLEAIDKGEKVKAIKLFRSDSGASLAEAERIIETATATE